MFSPFQHLRIMRSGGSQTVVRVAFAFGFAWQLKFQTLTLQPLLKEMRIKNLGYGRNMDAG